MALFHSTLAFLFFYIIWHLSNMFIMVYYAFTFLTLKNHLLTTTCDGWYYTNFFSICLVLWFQGCPLLGFIFAIEDIYSLNSELTFLFLRRNLSGFFNCILSYFISLYAWINVQCLYWRFYIYYRKNIPKYINFGIIYPLLRIVF